MIIRDLRFHSRPVLRHLAGDTGMWWELVKPLTVSWADRMATRRQITVYAGFTTDLASVPALARAAVSVVGRHTPAAILHDWLYEHRARYHFTRQQADRIFLRAMLVEGVPLHLARTMYLAVRAGGEVYWDRHGPHGAGSRPRPTRSQIERTAP